MPHPVDFTLDSVVGNKSDIVGVVDGRRSLPEERAEEEVVPLDGVVFSDDLAVDVGQPEDEREDSDDERGEDDGHGDGGSWEFVELELGGSLVHCVCVSV